MQDKYIFSLIEPCFSLCLPCSSCFSWLSLPLHASDWLGGKGGDNLSDGWFPSRHSFFAAKLLQSCPTLCNPRDDSPPGSSDPGILQARTLEWVSLSFSNSWKWKVKSENAVTQSCPTLSDPMDCSLPGSSVHGIFQSRVLEWGAIAFSNSFFNW